MKRPTEAVIGDACRRSEEIITPDLRCHVVDPLHSATDNRWSHKPLTKVDSLSHVFRDLFLQYGRVEDPRFKAKVILGESKIVSVDVGNWAWGLQRSF